MMQKIFFLGTAASIPTASRDNTSFVLQHRKQAFLIDCPGSPSHKLLKAGFDFKKIKHVIITHHHPDHIYGIIALTHTQGFVSTSGLTIYSNQTCIKIIKKLQELFKLTRSPYPAIRFVDVLRKNPFFCQGALTLTAIPNEHVRQSFGIKITCGRKRLLYSSDTAVSARMLAAAGRLDYCIHDCTASGAYFKKHPALATLHTSAAQLARYLGDTPRVKLIPVHFLLLDKNEEKRVGRELEPVKERVIRVRDFSAV